MKKLFLSFLLCLCCSVYATAQSSNTTLPKSAAKLSAAQKQQLKSKIAAFKRSCNDDDPTTLEFQVDTFSINSIEAIRQESDYSTLGMVEATMDAAADYDVLLNKYYNKLKNRLNAKEKASLQKSQHAWLTFRDADSEFASEITPNEGTVYRIVTANNHKERIANRVLQLFNYYTLQ
ncbi:MAG: DUF1311 domain-containing protein [Bacteroidaceae bacterium]|nr:DUF1311 domain-containing protein [Bacteroidaceae bacterium]